jgi:hypothetical protein
MRYGEYDRGFDWGKIFIGLVILFVVAGLIFMVYDRMTGTTKLEMGEVYDKYHEHETRRHSSTDSKGHTTYHTDEYDYYYICYRRKSGGSDKTDVGYWSFDKYRVGDKIVLKYTVGGRTGMEYFVGLEKFTGAEGM